MGYDDRREVLERLEALENLVRSHLGKRAPREDDRGGRERHHGHRDGRRHDRDRDRGDDDFQEKRVVDTIVRLVSEQVGRIVQDQQEKSARHDDGGSEKRVVDLIVGLVSERVQEIVSTELDRRFGSSHQPPAAGCESTGSPDPEKP